jgi:hypothetical protein
VIRAARVAGLCALAALGAGCASMTPPLPPDPLQRADREMAAAHYRDAMTLYEVPCVRIPSTRRPRGRGRRRARSASLFATQAERDRLRRAGGARRRVARLRQERWGAQFSESAGRTAEVTRLRRDLDARQAEVDRLQADLDRLRSIDLRREPSRR